MLDAVAAQLEALAPDRPASDPAAFVLAHARAWTPRWPSPRPSHPSTSSSWARVPRRLARRVRAAGCVFVGAGGATAFGDYVAGSNHCLPTGGAARFASGLSPRHFRRRMSEVHVGGAAAELAPAGAAIARAEGFAAHAESMEARVRENGPT